MKNKYTTIGIILSTIILAGVAIFTALRLYQTRQSAVAPNVPESEPDAAETIACSLSFSIATPTPSPSPTPTPTPTKSPSPTPSPSPIPLCNSVCTTSNDCPSGLMCSAGRCRNALCVANSNCVCATPTPSPSPTPTKSPSPTPTASPSPSPTATATATATTTSTATATATVTASPNPQCNYACTSNSNCPSGLICYIANGQTAGNCRNTQCLSETDCTCAVATATATTAPTTAPTYLAEVPNPTEQPALPEAGTSWPTILGAGFGILIIIGSLLLAL